MQKSTLLSHLIKAMAISSSLALLSACSSSDTPADKSEATATKTESQNAEQATDATQADTSAENANDVLNEKVSHYIECLNASTNRANQSIQRYQSWVNDMSVGPTGKETNVYGLYSINDSIIKDCQESISKGIALEPKDETLDTDAQNYLDALTNLATIVNEADKYYSREDFKDDDFAKAKEMHPKLAAAFSKFENASDVFSQKIDTIHKQLQAQYLAQLEKSEGKKFQYWKTKTSMDANDLVALIEQETFDVAEANKLLAEYEASSTELDNYLKSGADDIPTFGTSMTDDKMENFLKASKARIRRIRDNVAYTEGDKNILASGNGGWMVEGSPDNVIDAYNKLIDDFNGQQ